MKRVVRNKAHACSLLITAGEWVEVVSSRLGHASAAFTLDTYVPDTNEQQVAAAQRFAALLDG